MTNKKSGMVYFLEHRGVWIRIFVVSLITSCVNASTRTCIFVFQFVFWPSLNQSFAIWDLFIIHYSLFLIPHSSFLIPHSSSLLYLPGMRNINSKTLRKHIKLVAQQSKMRNPLDFILSIVHKSFVKVRCTFGQLYEHVGLLNIIQHTVNRSHVSVLRKGIPFVKVITLES